MKYLIALDIDGTLRHDDGTISKYSQNVLKALSKEGHYIVICTARPRYHTKKVNDEIGGSNYYICLSGSEIYDELNNKVLHESFISNKDVHILYDYASLHKIRIMFSNDDKEYVTKFTKNEDQVLLNKNNLSVLNTKIKECLVIDKSSKVKTFKNEMLKLGMNIIVSEKATTTEDFFVVVNENSGKGKALKYLREYLNIDKENVISFGNDGNDITMFKESGKALAVSNSIEKLKEIATEVIDSNNNDGVAKYLEKFIKEK